MAEDRNRRFWRRVSIGLAVGFVIYIVYVAYAVIEAGNQFKAGITD